MNDVKRGVVGWMRWLHIYLSMFSFAALLFFAITGITLNHTEWIEGSQKMEQFQGELDPQWVHPDSSDVMQLQVVEFLRDTHRIRAAVKDFRTDDSECAVSFKGPGFNADAFIDRATGQYELTITQSGLIAVMNDLHKGRDTGSVWAWLIDISAILMTLVSLTGLAMIFFLRKWRFNGLIIAAVGTVLLYLLYHWFV